MSMAIYEERWDLGKLVTFVPNKVLPVYRWFFLQGRLFPGFRAHDV